MADSRLRELERQAAQGGAQARARLLSERVRVGDLDLGRLRLASCLGDEASRLACEEEPPADLAATLEALAGWEREVTVRVLVAGVRRMLPLLEAWFPTEDRPADAVAAAEAWLATPTTDQAIAALEASDRAQGAANRITYELLPRFQIGMLSRAQITALEYVAWTACDAAEGGYRVTCTSDRPKTSSLVRLHESAVTSEWLAPDELRAAIWSALSEWVLA